MVVTHTNKAPAPGLVVQQVSVGNNQCLLTKTRGLYHNQVQVCINMGRASVTYQEFE
jgi:hypothetical protein